MVTSSTTPHYEKENLGGGWREEEGIYCCSLVPSYCDAGYVIFTK